MLRLQPPSCWCCSESVSIFIFGCLGDLSWFWLPACINCPRPLSPLCGFSVLPLWALPCEGQISSPECLSGHTEHLLSLYSSWYLIFRESIPNRLTDVFTWTAWTVLCHQSLHSAPWPHGRLLLPLVFTVSLAEPSPWLPKLESSHPLPLPCFQPLMWRAMLRSV